MKVASFSVFVEVSSASEVETAEQQLNGYELDGRKLRVNAGPPPPKREFPSREDLEAALEALVLDMVDVEDLVLVLETVYMSAISRGGLMTWFSRVFLGSKERLLRLELSTTGTVVDQRVTEM
ncbi:unnamed protein product [Eruca vesicaria subsp. sativa]|uniref:RRM domain-containing protein n=1 Tax=Eruca vesicaria subsp. sativa TaxID=29727 RepID=A0ABC8JA87_ERUVS|nr:unnamed protein product [Eruca vesicaria subsp. sativa]